MCLKENLEKGIPVQWRWPAKWPEAFRFALIFLFLFVSRQKEK